MSVGATAPAAMIMAHVRKDTLCVTPEWWKHLRKFLKRKQNKRERRAGKKQIERNTPNEQSN